MCKHVLYMHARSRAGARAGARARARTTQQKRKCTKSMLPVTCLHPEMSLGAYFQYEIYTSVFAV